jgi:hypothetical protein
MNAKIPYYIVAPRYIRTSAGCRVLYRLCDLINKAGGSAFIYLRPHLNYEWASSPMDVAPFLTKKTVDYHFENGLIPIVVYPETFQIAKFSAPVRVRYILNYDDLLFKSDPLNDDDHLIAYSENIANKLQTSKTISTIFIPVSDPTFYHPPAVEHRNGGVYYAGKYKYHFSGITYPITAGLPEITRDQLGSQTPEQIRELFQSCEFFYCYEDSALALEAILCGCPVVFLPNEHFKEALGAKELGGLGFAWSDTPEQLAHAKATIKEARERYFFLLLDVDRAVKTFIQVTQPLATNAIYTVPFASAFMKPPSLPQKILDLIRFLRDVVEDNGFKKALLIFFKRLAAKRFKIY